MSLEQVLDYKSKRIDPLVWLARTAYMDVVVRPRYVVRYENLENLASVEDKGFVILAKHQHWHDIPIIGTALHKSLKRNANYPMADYLPAPFVLLGGIPIMRIKDVKKLSQSNKLGREEKIKLLEKAREVKNEFYGRKIPSLLKQDEIVVLFPEGTRNFKTYGIISDSVLKKLVETQSLINKEIPFVPVDIHYEDLKKIGSEIKIDIRKPVYVDDWKELKDELLLNVHLLK